VGCTATLSGGSEDAGGRPDVVTVVEDSGTVDAHVPPTPEVRFESPATGSAYVRDAVVEGAWVARVEFQVRSQGVARVEVWADDELLLGEVDPTGALTYAFRGDGERRVAAVGRSASGEELARDEITLRIAPPADTSCHAMLTALGLDWAPASATRGIADPVRVQPVIQGVRFRYVSNSTPTAMLMDCELGVRLHQLATLVATYGFDEVIHIGIYNYRCIGGGDPDSGTCTPSQHAYARAIDLHAFGVPDGDETYSTEVDWVITSRGDSCPIESFSEKDRVLKELACAMWAERIFQIVLTPNYNDAHRNHFHVDLTAGSMYIGVGVSGVDPDLPGLGH
jgi:hypothetical protein